MYDNEKIKFEPNIKLKSTYEEYLIVVDAQD